LKLESIEEKASKMESSLAAIKSKIDAMSLAINKINKNQENLNKRHRK
jgi:hypothetical protein